MVDGEDEDGVHYARMVTESVAAGSRPLFKQITKASLIAWVRVILCFILLFMNSKHITLLFMH